MDKPAGLPSLTLLACLAAGPCQAQTASEVLAATGLTHGVVSHLGAKDGKLEVDLAGGGNFVVHGLALSNDDRDAARATILSGGFYGQASVETQPSLQKLPYPTRFVNLLVADLDALGPNAPPADEIKRVMAPLGYTYLKQGGKWTGSKYGMPSAMDGWAYFYADITATAASKDEYAAPPNTLKWISGIQNTRAPGAVGSQNGTPAESGFRADGGMVAYNVAELWKKDWSGPDCCDEKRQFVIRDAFSGAPGIWLNPTGSDRELAPGLAKFSTIFKDGYVYTSFKRYDYLKKIDARTGQVVLTYDKGLKYAKEWPFPTDARTNFIYGGKLYQMLDSNVVVLDLNTGAVLKQATLAGAIYHPVVVEKYNALVLALGSKVNVWRFPSLNGAQSVVALDLTTLEKKWSAPAPYKDITRLAYHAQRDMIVGFNAGRGDADGDNYASDPALFALKAADGTQLWSKQWKDGLTGMVVWNDQAWMEDIVADLADGTVHKDNTNPYDVGYNTRCVLGLASANYVTYGFTEYVSKNEKDGANLKRYKSYATRPYCSFGPVPAYGQWFHSPTGCGCISNKLEGFLSLGYEASPAAPVPDDQRLESGDSYYGAQKSNPAFAVKEATMVPGKNEALFADMNSTNWIYNRDSLPPPLDGGDRVFQAIPKGHRVEARQNGKVLWTFVADGPLSGGYYDWVDNGSQLVRTPVATMAYQGGKLYAGGMDGYVYCLDGATGKLQWRFLAAPAKRKTYAYGQLESLWPVYAITSYNGGIAFAAGRQAELDGGLSVWSLDPNSGAVQWKTKVSIGNIRMPQAAAGDTCKATTSCSERNQAMAWTGSKLRLGSLYIDPASPQSYVQGSQFNLAQPNNDGTTAIRFNPNRKRTVVPGALIGRLEASGGLLRVRVDAPGVQRLSLRDARGREARAMSGQGPNLYLLPLSGLADGAYSLQVEAGGRSETKAVAVGGAP